MTTEGSLNHSGGVMEHCPAQGDLMTLNRVI
jgi:hypothetical protein